MHPDFDKVIETYDTTGVEFHWVPSGEVTFTIGKTTNSEKQTIDSDIFNETVDNIAVMVAGLCSPDLEFPMLKATIREALEITLEEDTHDGLPF